MKIDRLVSIIMILLDKKRVSAKELANHFEVSLRTIYRDIEAINLAGIPVYATPGVGGGFEIMEKFKIEKNVFSTDDLSAILIGLSSISKMMDSNNSINALAKIKSFIPADHAKDIEVKTNQIHIDLNPWVGNKDIQPYLEIIKTALQQNKLLSFQYIDRHGEKTTRTVEPYQLVLKNNQWYYQGYCHKRHDFRLFKLSRISDLKMLKESFIPREYPSPQLDITNLVTPIQSNIKLRIHKSIMDRVLDYCSYENFDPENEEFYIVNFPCIENDYYYNVLLSLGDKCECLAPPHVRTRMQNLINRIAALYQK